MLKSMRTVLVLDCSDFVLLEFSWCHRTHLNILFVFLFCFWLVRIIRCKHFQSYFWSNYITILRSSNYSFYNFFSISLFSSPFFHLLAVMHYSWCVMCVCVYSLWLSNQHYSIAPAAAAAATVTTNEHINKMVK